MIATLIILIAVFMVAILIFTAIEERTGSSWREHEAERLYMKSVDEMLKREGATQRRVETRRFVRTCSEEAYVEAEFTKLREQLRQDIKVTWPPGKG